MALHTGSFGKAASPILEVPVSLEADEDHRVEVLDGPVLHDRPGGRVGGGGNDAPDKEEPEEERMAHEGKWRTPELRRIHFWNQEVNPVRRISQ
jgi:hypothetical protein